jgi:hypothetical protein
VVFRGRVRFWEMTPAGKIFDSPLKVQKSEHIRNGKKWLKAPSSASHGSDFELMLVRQVTLMVTHWSPIESRAGGTPRFHSRRASVAKAFLTRS